MSEEEEKIDFYDTIQYGDHFTRGDAKKIYKSTAVSELKRLIAKTTELEQYKEGDVLVKKNWSGDRYETMGDGVTKVKYKIIHITEEGMVFTKKYLQSGKLGIQVFCLNTDGHNYSIDPDLVDYILLDEEELYDPAEYVNKMNKKKQAIKAANRKSVYKGNTRKGRLAMFADFNLGDTIYYSYGMMGQSITEYKVEKINESEIVLKQNHNGSSSYRSYYNRDITIHKGRGNRNNFWRDKPKTMKDTVDV